MSKRRKKRKVSVRLTQRHRDDPAALLEAVKHALRDQVELHAELPDEFESAAAAPEESPSQRIALEPLETDANRTSGEAINELARTVVEARAEKGQSPDARIPAKPGEVVEARRGVRTWIWGKTKKNWKFVAQILAEVFSESVMSARISPKPIPTAPRARESTFEKAGTGNNADAQVNSAIPRKSTIQIKLEPGEADDPKVLLNILKIYFRDELGIQLKLKVESEDEVASEARLSARDAAWDRFLAETREWSKTLPPGHFVDDDRESIYEGRGE